MNGTRVTGRFAKTALVTTAAAAALAIVAPPASAEFTAYAIFIGPGSDGLTVEIFYNLTTDSPPISCKWSAKDLDQFGKFNAGARVHPSTSALNRIIFGPYAIGHDVQVDVVCRDRSGSSIGDSGVFTMQGEPL